MEPLVTGDPDYLEEVVLSDGTSVTLRAVRPEDKALFRRGMTRLSSRSRQSRFMFSRGDLTDSELAYLTELDGVDHLAIGALLDGEGVGVARFVRLEGEPDTAEPAITIIDELQGRGLGALLLRRLVDAARERGVTRFRADILGDNTAMFTLLRRLAPKVTELAVDAEVVTVEAAIIDEVLPGRGVIAQLLALAAQGLLRFLPPRASTQPASQFRDETSHDRKTPTP